MTLTNKVGGVRKYTVAYIFIFIRRNPPPPQWVRAS